MEAMSSSFLSNVFHVSSACHSSRHKSNLIHVFHISSSQTIQEDKPKQEPKSTTATSVSGVPASSKKLPLNPRLPLYKLTFDKITNVLTDHQNLRPCIDPKHVLANNYAPVDELPPTECLTIEGTLPQCLNGAYIRNGPNPQYTPRGPYHLFDGDGMLHCIRISDECATLCSRYVKTYKYNVEHDAGTPIFPNVFSSFISGLPTMFARGAVYIARYLSGQYKEMKNGVGLANTSLSYFGNKLFALGESDLPYQIRVTATGDVETLGRHDFDGKFSSLSNMTAHPKIDAQTGETFAFRYSPMFPFLTYFRFDSSGSKQQDVPITSMTNPAFIHDFAITEKYAVFVDIQIGMSTNLVELIAGGKSVVGVDKEKVPRIGVIPRYAIDDSEMRWFNVPGLNIIHAINAWDAEDSVVLVAPNVLPVEHTLERMDLIHASVEKVTINLKTGTVTRSLISPKNLDFGVINPTFIGRKGRYGYLGIGNPLPKTSGVVKLDWSSGGREVGCRMFGEGCYGGEPLFVPWTNDQQATEVEVEEDDGYLVMYVHDESSGESRFLVMDAKSPALDIVAAVKLPRRVPYGFHGIFVRETDLKKL
ncbi:9-cis-epoxycarotenoid dioxygenase [Ranunculus cassubicifolius]